LPSVKAEQVRFEVLICITSHFRLVPVKGKRNILVTSALPYVNNVPHLGNIIGCVLSADVFARYCRLRGHETLYICGTDEYGTATETKALAEGVTPREVCDKYHVIHKEIYEWFNIEFDIFGRTTTPQQTEIAQDIFLKLYENGFTSTSSIDQLHCQNCDKFLADRFVTGACPFCAYDDARGDQCDGCSRLINAVELKNPKCHICKQEPKESILSTHIFLHLDAIQDEVREYIEKEIAKPDTRWSSNAIAIVKGWIKHGLEKRCITRDLKWGTAVPLAGFENKVFYVWYDAPIGYLSITKCLVGDNWTKWWKNPENVELFNFIGKDNVAFHGVMFPCTQFGARDNYTVVNNICATEYLNYEDVKFSKSRNIGVFGDNAKETGIEADVWRFYLLYIRPESQDTSFSWEDFAFKVNSELLANLGNFINRALTFLSKNFDGVVPEMQLSDIDVISVIYIHIYNSFSHNCNRKFKWDKMMDSVHQRDAVRAILSMSRRGNQYMQTQQPWVLIKGSDEEKYFAFFVFNFHHRLVTFQETGISYALLSSNVSARIRSQCGSDRLPAFSTYPISYLKAGHRIGEPKPLFTKMESAKVAEWKAKFGGSCSSSSFHESEDAPTDDTIDIGRLDLRVGRIINCEKHPDADALYVEQIDVGESKPRTVVSGLVHHVPLNQMQNRLVVVLCNLKPAKMRGVESRAMVMCASSPEKVEIMEVDPSAQPGTPVICPPYLHRPDVQLNPKKKIWETIAQDLKVNEDGYAVWRDTLLLVGGSTKMTAPTLRGVFVK
uniref:Methionine--tRNA ligase, cytoplasmic n=1 Tax=Angiostrongylus costaricensis TaxID=334426 RepID=A0A0R3P9W0_ANGCS